MQKSGIPALEVKGITKSFGGIKAIDNITLTLENGRSRVLIGPNGAGKTTLFNLITGEIPVDEGEIFIHGTNVTKASVQKRSELGLVRTYQICNLFSNMTVEENIFLALKDKTWDEKKFGIPFLKFWKKSARRRTRVGEVLKLVAMDDKKDTLVSSLSHGEQRQVELAMALAPNPRLILFDEPMAGLSPTERVFIGALISNLAKEKNILVIEHDMDFALSITDDVTVLDFGKIVAEGSPEEIKANSSVKKIYKL